MTFKQTFILAALILALPAWGQSNLGQREVDVIRAHFDIGNYQRVLEQTRELFNSNTLETPQKIEIFKYAALSAYNLQDTELAQRYFLQLLLLDPDYVLDPYAVPPKTIEFFDDIRRANEAQLDFARQQLRSIEKEKATAAQANARAGPSTVLWSNVVLDVLPFGIGQFRQKRTGIGLALASTQAILAVTSVTSFFVVESMYQTQEITLDERIGGSVTYDVRGIPTKLAAEAETWKTVKIATGLAFYAVYAAGVIDALLHASKERSTTSSVASSAENQVISKQTLHLVGFPILGGAGAGMTLEF